MHKLLVYEWIINGVWQSTRIMVQLGLNHALASHATNQETLMQRETRDSGASCVACTVLVINGRPYIAVFQLKVIQGYDAISYRKVLPPGAVHAHAASARCIAASYDRLQNE